MDQFLNFKYHIKKITANLSSALFFLRRSKHLLTESALKTLYFSIFHCHLDYASLAWGNANASTLNPIIKKQKNAIRLISNAPYNAHTEPLFKKHKILRFEDLMTFSKLKFMHSYINNTLPGSFDGLWPYNRDRHERGATLRNAAELFIPRARLAFNARLPLHSFPKLWNDFNNEALKATVSSNIFKNNLKNYFLDDLAAAVRCNRAFCRDCYPQQD